MVGRTCVSCGGARERRARFCVKCGKSFPRRRSFLLRLVRLRRRPSDAETRTRRRNRRRLRLATFLTFTVGLFGSGIATGFALANRYGERPVPAVEVSSEAADVLPIGVEAVVPDVVGLPLADAENALADAGVDLGSVTVRQVEHAGAAGIVVAQDPRRMTRRPRAVRLDVSKPTVVPRVVGTALAAATSTLERLGARTVVTYAYVPGTAIGTVVASDPPAGKPLGEVVTLRTAGAPAAVYLDAVSAVSSDCGTGTADVSGRSLDHSVICSAYTTASGADYALNGDIDRFEAVVGLRDGAASTDLVRLRLLVDGREAYSGRFTVGPAKSVAIPLTGKRSLRIEVLATPETSYAALVVGEARFLGATAAVDRQASGGAP